MKLWLDDVREAPEGWFRVTSSAAALAYLRYESDKLEAISLDHDLGLWDTGMPVAEALAKNVDKLFHIRVYVHSMNPVGAERMKQVLRDAGWVI